MKLKLILLFTSLLTCIASFAYDFEVDGFFYNKTSDNTVEVTYGTENQYIYPDTIVIPNKIIANDVEYNVTSIGDYAFRWNYNIESVIIPNSVDSIGDSSFQECKKINHVTIPTSVHKIKADAFKDCGSIKEVIISNIESWCNIEFENRDSSPLRYNTHFFLDGSEIKNLIIPSSISTIKDFTFSGYRYIETIEIPQTITSIGNYSFSECRSLSIINFPQSIKSIGTWSFYFCDNLSSINIPPNIDYIGDYSFCCCSSSL
jgi:hypothetical protein